MSLSLKGMLAQALALVAAQEEYLPTHNAPISSLADSGFTLHLSRNRQDIAYLHRPTGGSGPIPTFLTAQLMAAWGESSSCVRPCPTALTPSHFEAAIRAYTTVESLPSGQLILRPTATVLGLWLWHFTQHSPPPAFGSATTARVPFPQHQAPLAQKLQLSPLALLQYIHMRCHHLACRLDRYDQALALVSGEGFAALAPQSAIDQSLWRSLIALVDALTVSPRSAMSQEQVFQLGYRLCEAADLWLRQPPSSSPATAMLLQGITQGLAHLLQGWLQAPAPTQF